MTNGEDPTTNVRKLRPSRTTYGGASDFAVSRMLLAGPPDEVSLLERPAGLEPEASPAESDETEVQWADGSPIVVPLKRQSRWKRAPAPTLANHTAAVAFPETEPWEPSVTAGQTDVEPPAPTAAGGSVELPETPGDGGEDEVADNRHDPAPAAQGDVASGRRARSRVVSALAALTLVLAGGGALVAVTLPSAHHAATVRTKAETGARSTAAPRKTSGTTTAGAVVKPATASTPTTSPTPVKHKRRHRRKHRVIKKAVTAPATNAAAAVRPAASSSSSTPVQSSQETSGSTASRATTNYADCPGLVSPDAGCQP